MFKRNNYLTTDCLPWTAVNIINFFIISFGSLYIYENFSFGNSEWVVPGVDVIEQLEYIILIVLSLFIGIIIGFNQWLILKSKFAKSIWWIWSTGLSFGVSFPLMTWIEHHNSLGANYISFLIVSIPVGIAQWLVLRKYFVNPVIWIAITGFFFMLPAWLISFSNIFILLNAIVYSLLTFKVLELFVRKQNQTNDFFTSSQDRQKYSIPIKQNLEASSYPTGTWIKTNCLSIIVSLLLLYPWFITIVIGVADTHSNDNLAIKGAIFFGIIGGTITGIIISVLQLFLMREYIPSIIVWIFMNILSFSLGLAFVGYQSVFNSGSLFLMIVFSFIIYLTWQYILIKKNISQN